MRKRLLCTDLDRTLIPNGSHLESPRARALFERIAIRPELTLVYVTGRHLALIEEAIREYSLPLPRLAIADVGTSIYENVESGWKLVTDWHLQLQKCWPDSQVAELVRRLRQFPALTLQEEAKQSRFKVSYYAIVDDDFKSVMSDVDQLVADLDLSLNLIWSHDQATGHGLLDILPHRANKLTAISYVMDRLGFDTADTLFAGDSGNDMQVFCSAIPCVIVANADEEIKQCAKRDDAAPIYVARGSINDMNGNYVAGIIEGACHFWPEVRDWIQDN